LYCLLLYQYCYVPVLLVSVFTEIMTMTEVAIVTGTEIETETEIEIAIENETEKEIVRRNATVIKTTPVNQLQQL